MANTKKGSVKKTSSKSKTSSSKKNKNKKNNSKLMIFLNRDVKEFNTTMLFVLSILFITICGIISYCITNSVI